mgnify:CR=1 FL=1
MWRNPIICNFYFGKKTEKSIFVHLPKCSSLNGYGVWLPKSLMRGFELSEKYYDPQIYGLELCHQSFYHVGINSEWQYHAYKKPVARGLSGIELIKALENVSMQAMGQEIQKYFAEDRFKVGEEHHKPETKLALKERTVPDDLIK